MKFSIIIPIFNRTSYIQKTLDSVLNQSYRNLEIICVDDCSSDDSLNILKSYAEKDIRINILEHKENKGPHVSRKTGVQNASSDYILFLDCDDTLQLDALKVIYDNLSKNAVQVLEYGFFSTFLREKNLPDNDITQENLFTSIAYHTKPCRGNVWNKVYNTELVKKSFEVMSDFYAVMGEDFYESVIIAYYAKTYRSIKNILLFYNDESGVSNTKKNIDGIKRDLYSIGNILKGFRDFFEKYAPEHKSCILNIEKYYIHYMYYNQILLKTSKSDRYASVSLMENCFTDEVVFRFLNKTKFLVSLDFVLYKIRASVKKLIPKNLRIIIKKIIS